MNGKFNKNLSVSWWIYVLAIMISVILFVPSFMIRKTCDWWTDLLLNLGIGIIASTIVAVFIDYGETKRKNKADKNSISLILADLKNECAELPSEMYIAVYETFGYNSHEKYKFDEWTNKLFDFKDHSNPDKQIEEIIYVIQTIDEIQKKAREALELMRYSIGNTCITDEIMEQTKKLGVICGLINTAKKRTDYNNCKKLILGDLKPLITEIFPDLKIDFTRSYNEEDYT